MQGKNRERFVALAENRVNKAIKSIRLVGNLSIRSNYAYSEDEAKKIVAALENEIKLIKMKFLEKGKSTDSFFSLKG